MKDENFIREDGSYDIRMLPEILNETILRLKPVINMPSGSNIDDLKKKEPRRGCLCLAQGILLA